MKIVDLLSKCIEESDICIIESETQWYQGGVDMNVIKDYGHREIIRLTAGHDCILKIWIK